MPLWEANFKPISQINSIINKMCHCLTKINANALNLKTSSYFQRLPPSTKIRNQNQWKNKKNLSPKTRNPSKKNFLTPQLQVKGLSVSYQWIDVLNTETVLSKPYAWNRWQKQINSNKNLEIQSWLNSSGRRGLTLAIRSIVEAEVIGRGKTAGEGWDRVQKGRNKWRDNGYKWWRRTLWRH